MAEQKHPDSLAKVMVALFQVGLVLVGLIGLSVEFFRDNGILKQTLNKMLNSSLGLWSIPLAILALYILNKWINSQSSGKASKRGNLPMYLMMAIGAFFTFRLITTGGF